MINQNVSIKLWKSFYIIILSHILMQFSSHYYCIYKAILTIWKTSSLIIRSTNSFINFASTIFYLFLSNCHLKITIIFVNNIVKTLNTLCIVYVNVIVKIYYDKIHNFFNLHVENMIFLRLHHEYVVSKMFNKKLFNQWIDSFRVIVKINSLIYWLNFSFTMQIHFVVLII